MTKLFKVARQEFKMTAANKAFVIITLLGPFLLLAITVLPTLIAQREGGISDDTKVAVAGLAPDHWTALKTAAGSAGISLSPGDSGDVETLKEQVRQGTLDGLLIIPENYLEADSFPYYSRTGTDIALTQTLEAMTSRIITAARMAREGLDPQIIESLSRRPAFRVLKVSQGEAEEGQDFLSIMLTCIAFMMLIYMTVLLYGQMIGRSVIKEKSSKTVEIILSSVTPGDMMFGKLLGIGLAGIIQYTFWITLALALSRLILPGLGVETTISGVTPVNMAFLGLFFVLAYFLYSACYAAIGSGAEDEQHMGQLGMPLLLFLILPMVMVSNIVMNPGSPFTVGLSFFPMTAPLVMLMRIIISLPPWWEILLSVALISVTTLLVVAAAARIFRVGILMTGKRFSLREMLRWVGYGKRK